MRTSVYLTTNDIARPHIHVINDASPYHPNTAAYVILDGSGGQISGYFTADECRRIAASWQALGDEIARQIVERHHEPLLDRAFGDGRTICEPTAPSVNSEASGSAGVPFDSGVAAAAVAVAS